MTTPALDMISGLSTGEKWGRISALGRSPSGKHWSGELQIVRSPVGGSVELFHAERGVPIEWLRRPAQLEQGFLARVRTERGRVKKNPLRRLAYRWSVSALEARDPAGREWKVLEQANARAAKLALEHEFACMAVESWRSHSTFEIAGGAGRLVSLAHEEVHCVPRPGETGNEAAKVRLSTVDLTSGEAVQLDSLIGAGAFEALKCIVIDELGRGWKQMIAMLDLERTIRSSFAIALSAVPGFYDVIVGVPASTESMLDAFTFRVSKTAEIEDLVEKGFYFSSPRVHDEMLMRLHQFETVPREGILSDVRVFASDVRRELLRRGWELRSKLYDGYGPSEGWDLRDMTGKRAGQKLRFYEDGAVAFTTFTPELTQTIRMKDGRIENSIWHNDQRREVMASELAR